MIRQRKDQKTVNVKMLKKLTGRLRSTFFRIMEDDRLKFEEERLKENYFNFNF